MVSETVTKFGLRHKGTGRLLTVHRQPNSSEFCNEFRHELLDWDGDPWLVSDLATALFVQHEPTPLYNASYDTPFHDFEGDELEVFEVVVTTTATPAFSEPPKWPTTLELAEWLGEVSADKRFYLDLVNRIKSGAPVVFDRVKYMRYLHAHGFQLSDAWLSLI